MLSDISELMYYPGMKRWWESVEGVVRVWTGRSLRDGGMPHPIASELIKYMDEADVDVTFALREPMMDVTGGVGPMSTNGFIMKQIEPYPDRMYLECNVGPILRRGVKHAIWELEYLVTQRGAKLCKVYQPEDSGPLNDPQMWPFYEKAQELGVPLTIHTGMSYVVPQPTRYTLPILLDDILLDFPDLKVIAYHMGWPYHEELFGLAGKHKNLFISVSGIIGWFARAPYKGYHLIGEALEWAGPDKIVMGLDQPFNDLKRCVDYIRNFEIPEDLRENYGYPEITDDIRAKILGLNLANLTGIEPIKRTKKAAAAAGD
jgi:predicted TIM-barrel fold metal-dependent hydrolase